MTITLTREEAQQVLDALVSSTGELHLRLASPTDMQLVNNKKAIETLRTRLAQPEPAPTNNGRYLTGYKAQPEPEPVAWIFVNKFDGGEYLRKHSGEGLFNKDEFDIKPLYTAPPPCQTCVSLARAVMMDKFGRS